MNSKLFGVIALVAASIVSMSAFAGNKNSRPVVTLLSSGAAGFQYGVSLSGGKGLSSTLRSNPGSSLAYSGPGKFFNSSGRGFVIFKMRDGTQVVLADATRSFTTFVRPAQCTADEIANNNLGCCNPALPGTCLLQPVATQMDSPALDRVQQGNLQSIKAMQITCSKEIQPAKGIWTFYTGAYTDECTLNYVND